MKISNVVEIYDNGEFVTLVTKTGSAVHLPEGEHSITCHVSDTPMGWRITDVTVDVHSE